MTANADALQGSLFENPTKIHQESEDKVGSGFDQISDLSEANLLADAEKRPRKRQKVTSEPLKRSATSKSKRHIQEPNWTNHSLVDREKLTPMLRHYRDIKASNPERILLYRLGDFFECFFEDAILLSQILELTLTGKEGGKEIGRVPMAGIPHHAAERYCGVLISRGLSIALCDQLEDKPSDGNLLKRGITRVLTPGTILEEGMLAARRNNWLAAVVISQNQDETDFHWGLANADVSTGEFHVKQSEGKSELHQALSQLEASEVLIGDNFSTHSPMWCPNNLHLTPIPSTPFNQHEAEANLKKKYKLQNLECIGLKEFPLSLRAAGGLVEYLETTNPLKNEAKKERNLTPPLDLPLLSFDGDSLRLDSQTRKNLELTTTQRNGQFHGSLLWALDQTLTAMGGRCLRRWIEAPLISINEIKSRQNLIGDFVKQSSVRKSLRKILRQMGDLERLAGRAGAGQANARDLVAIADGIERLPYIAEHLKLISGKPPAFIHDIAKIDSNLAKIASNIRDSLIDIPPLNLNEGGLIHDNVNKVLDGLRNQIDDQEYWLKSQELLEKKNSGINNLRLQYHRTFGYFLAVSKSKATKVPSHWIRRQTLANEERFVTPELKSREGKIFQLKNRCYEKEYEIFCSLRDEVGEHAREIRKFARAVASLDAILSLGEVAATNGYCSPEIINDDSLNIIEIEKCRHPVVEQLLAEVSFVPNNIHLGGGTDLIVLTGPNASGKSCYLRQIGLVQLLAQVGSWVPAEKARLSITDQIFTRVGAVDDLAAGQSTFMVEMSETAYILHHATKKSLVLLDEIGRGTATFDGLSIAWSVSEYLAKNLSCKTVFATHYHELNHLSERLNNVSNFQVLVKETGNDLVFLHKVVTGGASKSYGIEVARLAGIPLEVVNNAKIILNNLETKDEALDNTKFKKKADSSHIDLAA